MQLTRGICRWPVRARGAMMTACWVQSMACRRHSHQRAEACPQAAVVAVEAAPTRALGRHARLQGFMQLTGTG